MIPQLDGPGSLPIRDHTRGRIGRFWIKLNKTSPNEAPIYGELLQLGEENMLEKGMIMMIIGDCIGTKDP